MSSPAPTLPFSLAANPRLSSWIRFTSDGQVTVSPGKVEIGQGIVTALAQIAADELDVDIGRVQMVRATTAASPKRKSVTSGSLSIQHSGRALRAACAEIRQIFLAAASIASASMQARSRSTTAPSRVPAMSEPAIGSSPTKSRSTATRRRGCGRNRLRSARLPANRCSASTFPTRCLRNGVSFMTPRCPGCCMAGCCDPKIRAQGWLH